MTNVPARFGCCSPAVAWVIVAVGDELVAGFVLDTNSHRMAEGLGRLGRPVKRIAAVRDREDDIAGEATTSFCSGGLGPTPDDRTFGRARHRARP